MSSGRAASVLFNAVCISAAVPSKNLPQPGHLWSTSFAIPSEAWNITTSDEECIPSENHFRCTVLHEPTDAVLCVARRMQSLDCYSRTNLEGLVLFGRPSDRFTVSAADDRNVFKLSELTRSREKRRVVVQMGSPPFSCFLQHGPSGCFLCVSTFLGTLD